MIAGGRTWDFRLKGKILRKTKYGINMCSTLAGRDDNNVECTPKKLTAIPDGANRRHGNSKHYEMCNTLLI